MKATQMNYPFEISPLLKEEGSDYAVTFPDLADRSKAYSANQATN